jgi:hypothetical protein
MDKKQNTSFSYQQHVTKKTSTQIVVTTTSILSLPSLVPTLLKLWLLHPQDVRKDCRSLDIAIFHKSSCAPISKAQKCACRFRGEAVMHVWEEEETLTEYTLNANRRTCCCKKTKQISMSSNEANPTLTGYGVIVEGHPIQVWILVTVIEPPTQKIIIQDIFRFSAQVAAHFINGVDGEVMLRLTTL